MLYKFKSRATADLIMLDAQGRRILKIMGKEPTPQGIVTVAQIPAAIAAIEAAVAAEARGAGEAQPPEESKEAQQPEGDAQDRITLRQRAAPFLDMLRRSAAEDADVVWGT